MNKLRHTLLGLFLFAALGLLGIVTIVLGDFDLGGETREYTFYFSNVDGLEKGNPVTVYGVKLGRVESIEFYDENDPERRLAVTVRMDTDLDLYEGTQVHIASQSLLGGKRVEIETGSPPAPQEAQNVRGKVADGIDKAIGGLVSENRPEVQSILTSLASILQSVSTGDKTLTDYLLAETPRADLHASLAFTRKLIQDLVEGDGTAALLLRDPSAYNELVSVMKHGDQVLTALAEGDGAAALFLRDRTLYDHATEVLRVARTLADRTEKGEGLVGRAFAPGSEVLWKDVERTLANARSISDGVRAGEGLAGLVLVDPALRSLVLEIASNAETISTEIAQIIEEVSAGGGLLGYLVADEEARRSIRRFVAMATGAIEDAREAAPVSSFTSFLFGQL